MSANILIFHAQDALDQAQKVQSLLQAQNFEVATLDNFKKTLTRDFPAPDFYKLAVDMHDEVVFIVSDGLFQNCHLKNAILLAFSQGKGISAQKQGTHVILPTWFISAFKSFNNTFDEVVTSLQTSNQGEVNE